MPWRSPAFDGRKHHNKLKSLIIVPVWALRLSVETTTTLRRRVSSFCFWRTRTNGGKLTASIGFSTRVGGSSYQANGGGSPEAMNLNLFARELTLQPRRQSGFPWQMRNCRRSMAVFTCASLSISTPQQQGGIRNAQKRYKRASYSYVISVMHFF